MSKLFWWVLFFGIILVILHGIVACETVKNLPRDFCSETGICDAP
jgi:hypothetical protein